MIAIVKRFFSLSLDCISKIFKHFWHALRSHIAIQIVIKFFSLEHTLFRRCFNVAGNTESSYILILVVHLFLPNLQQIPHRDILSRMAFLSGCLRLFHFHSPLYASRSLSEIPYSFLDDHVLNRIYLFL